MTMKDMCEEIAEWLNATPPGSPKVTGMDVFNMSPTGELWPVFELYEQMKEERLHGRG
jgi:hypothetical protein